MTAPPPGLQGIEMSQLNGTLGPGRPFSLAVPSDITWEELCALIRALTVLPQELRRRRGPSLIVPRTAMRPS